MYRFRTVTLGLWMITFVGAMGAKAHFGGKPPVTLRASQSPSGFEGNNTSYNNKSTLSSDGRFLVFESYAGNLVSGDVNNYADIFERDCLTGVTTRVSVSSAGVEANGNSSRPSVSMNGRYVAFESSASNLVAGTPGGDLNVFVHDTLTGSTQLVSVTPNGLVGNGRSEEPSISSDGRFVAFHSLSNNLVPGVSSDQTYVRDLQTGVTNLVSANSFGLPGNGYSKYPSISGDGRYVAFESTATNLDPRDTNDGSDIFVRDRQTQATILVSADLSGVPGGGRSVWCSISADGRYVAFESDSPNLVGGAGGIFVKDVVTGAISMASVSPTGAPSNYISNRPSISADGRYVAFDSMGSNLVSGDTNGYRDIFLRDLQLGITVRVSVSSNGVQTNRNSYAASVSAKGPYVAFDSDAFNLVSGDSGNCRDVFIRGPRTYSIKHP